MKSYFFDDATGELLILEGDSVRVARTVLTNESRPVDILNKQWNDLSERVINDRGVPSGGGTKEPEDPKPKKNKRGKYACSICKKPGHRASTCPQKEKDIDTIIDEDDSDSEEYNFEAEDINLTWSPSPATRMEFGRIKISQRHDITSTYISEELNLPLKDVNAVMASKTYDDYLKMRPKR